LKARLRGGRPQEGERIMASIESPMARAAPAAADKHPDYAVRGLNPHRVNAIERYAHGEIIDVGCGNGRYVLHFADRLRIRGIDYQAFDAWKARPELFSVADAQELTLPDASADTLVSFETLEHLPDPEKALREYFRVSRRGLILTVPNCRITPGMRQSGLIYNHWVDRTHLNFWDLDSICALVARAGFTVRHREAINDIDLVPLFVESLGLGTSMARLANRLFKRRQRLNYPMTSLVVAERSDP
jgi:SAM-dependent methyltransferase